MTFQSNSANFKLSTGYFPMYLNISILSIKIELGFQRISILTAYNFPLYL